MARFQYGLRPRNFPLPRGDLTHNYNTLYSRRIASGSLTITPLPNKIAQGGLYNDSTLGAFLVVLDYVVYSKITGDYVSVQLVQGRLTTTTGTLTDIAGTTLDSLAPPIPGRVMGATGGAALSGPEIWRLCGSGLRAFWPYDDVFMLLPPGFGLYAGTSNAELSPLSFALSWFEIPHR